MTPPVSTSDIPAVDTADLSRLAAAETLLIATDFDGVLAPLVPNPADSRALPEAYAALVDLAALPRTHVAIISGRSLGQLDTLLSPPAAWHLVGSHGAERQGADSSALAAARDSARSLADELRTLVADRPGVTLETKPFSVAVHVRNAPRDVAAEVLSLVRSGPGAAPGIHVTDGKEVIELVTVEVSKGAALIDLRAALSADTVVYGGDDVTDERAFAVLSPGDFGVKVGPGETLANRRLADPAAYAAFLVQLAAARGRSG